MASMQTCVVVHGLPACALQLRVPPQLSVPLQNRPSVQLSDVGVFSQAPEVHESAVHGLPSSQPSGTQTPPQHDWLAVHSGVRRQVAPSQAAVSHGPATQLPGVHVGF